MANRLLHTWVVSPPVVGRVGLVRSESVVVAGGAAVNGPTEVPEPPHAVSSAVITAVRPVATVNRPVRYTMKYPCPRDGCAIGAGWGRRLRQLPTFTDRYRLTECPTRPADTGRAGSESVPPDWTYRGHCVPRNPSTIETGTMASPPIPDAWHRTGRIRSRGRGPGGVVEDVARVRGSDESHPGAVVDDRGRCGPWLIARRRRGQH